ncbi:hypothetical protein [Actinophytocola algeriensis]|uniref:Uncharacterized protein n=1 Tax=Actinophytocola algeriensis TaxID=1768010 RepID=A0A7W7Q7M8_9PSEU|nr:hypothetical protein [Actinophytocola algeriensis]MBB4908149.1 hypothetical protein [Actinophytocola algeriensis]MBE1480179.1 hypothetical protein [Actinophytocola algeriensis]
MTATITTPATTTATPKLLREAVLLDGFATLPSGVLLAALAGVLTEPFGIPAGVLLGAGLFFVAWGAAVLFLGFRPVVNRRATIAVGIVNMVCAVDGLIVQLAGIGELTTLGSVVLVALSVVVLALGALQVFAATRRTHA